MDLIASVLAFIFTFAAGVTGNVIAHDICSTADIRCKKIIGRAAARLAPFDREETEKEWLGDLFERETVHAKFRHAIGCWLAAPKMRRQATTIKIDVHFKISSVGTVPLVVTIDPVFAARLLNDVDGSSWIAKQFLPLLALYYIIKVFRAVHKLGPGSVVRFVSETKNFKKWDVDVKIRRKGIDLDMSKFVKLWMVDKEKGLAAFKQVSETLKDKPKSPDGVY